MENKSKVKRVSETVESGVEGLFEFLFRYFRTIYLCSIYPKNAIRILLVDRKLSSPKYVLPLTYSAIGMFLLSIVTGVAGTSLINWIWFEEEIWKNIAAKMSQEVSMLAIALGSIPAMVGMMVIVGIQRACLGKSSKMRQFALLVNCYGIGTQSFFIFSVAVIFAIVNNALDVGPVLKSELISKILSYFILGISGLFFIYATIGTPYFISHNLIKRKQSDQKFRNLTVLITIWILTISGCYVYPVLSDMPNRAKKIATQKKPISLSVNSDVFVELGKKVVNIYFDIVIHNPSEDLMFTTKNQIYTYVEFNLSSDKVIQRRDKIGFKVERIKDETDSINEFISVSQGAVIWRRIYLSAQAEDVSLVKSTLNEDRKPCVSIQIFNNNAPLEAGCFNRTFKFIESD